MNDRAPAGSKRRPNRALELARGLGGYFSAALVLSLFYLGGAFEFAEARLFDLKYGVTSRQASDEITLVAIDSSSLKELGVWPWPRPVYTRALDNILKSGAEIVAVNVDFSTLSDAESDRELEETLARYGKRVVLPVFAQKEGSNIVYTGPRPEFAQHTYLGSSNLFPDNDGIVRRARLAMEWRNSTLPSLAAIMAGADENSPGQFYVDYAIAPESFTRVSFADLFYGRFEPAVFSGKKVIIGATAGEIARGLPSPAGPAVPGNVLHILAAESLLQGRAMWRSTPLFGLIGIFLTIFTLAPFCAHRPLSQGVAVVAAGSGIFLALSVASQAVFPVLVDSVPWLVAALVALGLGMARVLSRQNLRLLAQRLIIGQKEAYVRSLEETAFDGVIAIDGSGVIRSVNPSAVSMLGRSQEELSGKQFDGFLDFSGREAFKDLLTEPRGRDKTIETAAFRSDGEKFVTRLAVTPVPEENGQTLFVILMLDITGLRQAEAEAADVRTRLTESLQAISEGIALWNSDDRLVTCNARFIEFHAAVARMLVPGCRFADFVRQSVMFGAPQEAIGREGEWIAERIERHNRP